MAEETKSEFELRLNIDEETGNQVLCIGGIKRIMLEREVDDLIAGLTAGKSHSARWTETIKTRFGIRKEYNGIGKPIESKLKTAEEAREVIPNEAA